LMSGGDREAQAAVAATLAKRAERQNGCS